MEQVITRKVTIEDILTLQEIGKITFDDTFAESNTRENMDQYLEEEFSVKKLTEQLSNIYSPFYFALLNNQVIGYLKVNLGNAQTELQDDKALEIERIYVLRAFHGKKVGQILYEKAIEVAMHHKVNYVWLGVWEENKRALAFYAKNGFVEFDQHIFRLGDDEQTDIMMKKILNTSQL